MFYWFVDDAEMSRAMARARRERSDAITAFFAAIGRGLVPSLRAATRGFRRWRQRQRAIRDLQVLDDRTLKDIGVSRGEIGSVVGDLMAGRPRRGAARPIRPAVAISYVPDAAVRDVPAAVGAVPAIDSTITASTLPAARVLSADQKQLAFLLNCYDVWSATPARSYPCDQEAAIG
jgi:uncharacterized protein YjiS (DUF1127 family)